MDLKASGFSESAQATYACQRRAFISNVLIHFGARPVGVRIAASNARQAISYGLTSIAVDMMQLLREHAALTGDVTHYEKYNSSLYELLSAQLAEMRGKEFFERAHSILRQRTGATGELVEQLDHYAEETASLFQCHRTFSLALNSYRLAIMSHSAANRHYSKITSCEDAIQYLNSVPHLSSKGRLAEFYLQKLESHIVTRDYANGSVAATECRKLLTTGTNNWFGFAEFYFLLLMHTEHFTEAEALYREATEHPRFANMPDAFREKWKIYELYLLYALRSLPEYESLPLKKNFDLQAFLRFVPTAAKDKHGMHIAVLIIHILYMLEAGDFSGIIDRMDALRTYRSRYLRTSANRRSSIFLKLLTIMENNSFSYKLTRAKSERFYKQLLAASAEEAETNEELQVIPYEWLWQRVMEKLLEYEEKFPVRA